MVIEKKDDEAKVWSWRKSTWAFGANHKGCWTVAKYQNRQPCCEYQNGWKGKEIVIQGLTLDFWKQMKLNCGAKRHHYSMFNVGRSTCPQCLWVVLVECPCVSAWWQWPYHHRLWCMAGGCPVFIFFSKSSSVHPAQKNNLALMGHSLSQIE